MRGDSVLLSADHATASSSSRKNMGLQVPSEGLIDSTDQQLSTRSSRGAGLLPADCSRLSRRGQRLLCSWGSLHSTNLDARKRFRSP